MEWDTLLSLGLLLIVWNCFLVTMYLLVLGLLYGMGYFIVARLVAHCMELFSSYNVLTARTARFSKKSPWSVFFRGEMSVICHKITVKCQ